MDGSEGLRSLTANHRPDLRSRGLMVIPKSSADKGILRAGVGQCHRATGGALPVFHTYDDGRDFTSFPTLWPCFYNEERLCLSQSRGGPHHLGYQSLEIKIKRSGLRFQADQTP